MGHGRTPKKALIKIHEDGQIEIVTKDADVLIVLQTPDGAQVEMHQGDKKVWDTNDWEQ